MKVVMLQGSIAAQITGPQGLAAGWHIGDEIDQTG